MYAEDDPLLLALRPVALSFPEAVEKESWGRPTFRAGKIFATYGVTEDHPRSLIVRPDLDDRVALLQDPRFFVPPYYGPSGWLGLDLAAAAPDWDEVREMLDASYRQVANQRMLRALDALRTP